VRKSFWENQTAPSKKGLGGFGQKRLPVWGEGEHSFKENATGDEDPQPNKTRPSKEETRRKGGTRSREGAGKK